MGVRDERIGHVAHMRHAFATIAVVQTQNFDTLADIAPQRQYSTISPDEFKPSFEELSMTKAEYAIFIARSASKLLPYFACFKNELDKPILASAINTEKKNIVHPFSICMKNEQQYSDTIDILDSYEEDLSNCYDKAGIDFKDVKIHVGGDQMTRERFSGAKCLRDRHKDSQAAFAHLSPITFELFHMLMNFAENTFKDLFRASSVCEVGTLKFIQQSLSRASVNGDVKKHYDAHKEFICDVTDIYSALAVMNHFGMTSVHGQPSRCIPDPEWSESQRYNWFMSEISSLAGSLLHTEYKLEHTEGRLLTYLKVKYKLIKSHL